MSKRAWVTLSLLFALVQMGSEPASLANSKSKIDSEMGYTVSKTDKILPTTCDSRVKIGPTCDTPPCDPGDPGLPDVAADCALFSNVATRDDCITSKCVAMPNNSQNSFCRAWNNKMEKYASYNNWVINEHGNLGAVKAAFAKLWCDAYNNKADVVMSRAKFRLYLQKIAYKAPKERKADASSWGSTVKQMSTSATDKRAGEDEDAGGVKKVPGGVGTFTRAQDSDSTESKSKSIK